ncbi:hypothetical protein [Streptomyces noursei]|uniref:hypothetical protein n=1 Tax=Streptomyces noursei TaxID=1971 RepID=UPI0011AEF622|nr:hypothetical protein [Streptomyces noursei]
MNSTSATRPKGMRARRLAAAVLTSCALAGAVSGLTPALAHAAVNPIGGNYSDQNFISGVNKVIDEAQNSGNKDKLTNAYGDSPECVAIQHQMDKLYPWTDANNIGQAVPYTLAAVFKGCKFIGGGNPYHVKNPTPSSEPGSYGDEFSLQTMAKSSDCRGVWIDPKQVTDAPAGIYGLKGANNSRGCTAGDASSSKNSYRFVSVGKRLAGRDAFVLVAASGPQAGKCVNIADALPNKDPNSAVSHTFTVMGDCSPDHLWTVSGYNGGPGSASGYAIDGFHRGQFKGVMDLHWGDRGHEIILQPFGDSWNQNFLFRPPHMTI